jgi:hypothetical protein
MMSARLMKLSLCLLLCVSFVGAARAQRVIQDDAEAPLTNASVIKLVRAGFREKTLITIIRSRPVSFDLTPDRLIELKKGGVSEKVILAMLARENTSVAEDDGWDDDTFFKMGSGATDGSGARRGDGSSQGEQGIFGSSTGTRNRSRSTTGSGGGTDDSQTTGSATVRILRPPTEAGGAPPKLDKTPTLTNDSIVELVEAGFSEGTIVRRIEQSPVEFDLAPSKLTELRRRRVTEPVIAAMKNAMEEDGAPARPEK